jgi:hypothetical protein
MTEVALSTNGLQRHPMSDVAFNEEVREKEEMEQNKPFRVITGGKGGGEPPSKSKHWLNDVPEGSIFLVEERDSRNFILPQFAIDHRYGKAIKIYSYIDGALFWTTAERFSNRFNLIEILALGSSLDETNHSPPSVEEGPIEEAT